MNTTPASFSPFQRASITALCADLTTHTGQEVNAAYGATDEGHHWAALCVEDLPAGAWGTPGPLVTLAIAEDASGLIHVMTAEFVMHGAVEFTKAHRGARTEAVRMFRQMSKGAFKVA